MITYKEPETNIVEDYIPLKSKNYLSYCFSLNQLLNQLKRCPLPKLTLVKVMIAKEKTAHRQTKHKNNDKLVIQNIS